MLQIRDCEQLGSKKTDDANSKGDIVHVLVGSRLGFTPFELLWLLIHHSLIPCGPDAGQANGVVALGYHVFIQFEVLR